MNGCKIKIKTGSDRTPVIVQKGNVIFITKRVQSGGLAA